MRRFSSLFAGLTLDRITKAEIAAYRDERIKTGRSPQTVVHELRTLSRAFDMAKKEWGWIAVNPCVDVDKPKVGKPSLERWLTSEEEERLFKAAEGYLNSQLAEIITVALHTGMRQSEILNLKWKDVDLFGKKLSVMQPKTRVMKTIPFSETLYKLLLEKGKVKSMSGFVFRTGNDTRILNTNLQREWYEALKAAKIENFRFHDLRHTFATRLVQSGVDLYAVSKLLGHTDFKTTQRYAHHNPERFRPAVKVLDSFSDKEELQIKAENG